MTGPPYLNNNPTVPTFPANGVWTFAQRLSGMYLPLTSFNPSCSSSPSTPLTFLCWEAALGQFPLIGASPTATINLNNSFSSIDLIQGMVLVHPSNNARAVISWRSNVVNANGTVGFTGNVRILGRVAHLDPACSNASVPDDGVRLFIRKSTVPGPLPIPVGSTIAVPFTSVPAAPIIYNSSKTFTVNSTVVTPGTEILFEIDNGGNNNILCDGTSIDILITKL